MRYRFGEKIRIVRERRGRTLKEVAESAGVSESLVSQIERNKVSPAIDTLLSLADALDIDLEYLFSDFRKERAVKIVRRSERAVSSRPGVVYQRLAELSGDGDGGHGIEAYLITLDEGAETGHGEYGHPGCELGIVQRGSARLELGSAAYQLGEGDSVSFQADVPHRLKNAGVGVLETLWVVTPPRGAPLEAEPPCGDGRSPDVSSGAECEDRDAGNGESNG